MLERGEVLGIDPNTNTGFAYGIAGEVPRLWSIDFRRDGDLHDYYGNLLAYAAAFLRDNPVKLIGIEEPLAPSGMGGRSNHDTTMVTIGSFAIWIGIAKAKKIPYQPVRVETWRKHFIGVGRLAHIKSASERRKEGKRLVEHRCKLLGWKAPDDNAADAGGIWDWAGASFMSVRPDRLQLFGA